MERRPERVVAEQASDVPQRKMEPCRPSHLRQRIGLGQVALDLLELVLAHGQRVSVSSAAASAGR
jgi:hypothetical protein